MGISLRIQILMIGLTQISYQHVLLGHVIGLRCSQGFLFKFMFEESFFLDILFMMVKASFSFVLLDLFNMLKKLKNAPHDNHQQVKLYS